MSSQIKVGAALNYVVIGLNTLVGLVYTPFMLHKMGQSEYGLYSLVASIIAYLTILDFGLGNAIIRYTAKFIAEKKIKEQYEMFGMFFILYLIVGFLALIIGLTLYFNVDALFGNSMTLVELNRAKIMMLILLFNLVFTFPMSIFGSIITAYEHFVFPKVVNIFRIILNTLIMIILLQLGYRAVAMVVLITIFNFLTLILNFIYCKKILHIQILFVKFQWPFLKEVTIYSFWIFLNVIMDRVYWSTGQFVLGSTSGTIAVSIFAIAIHLQGIYMTFSTAISSVFLPKITSMIALKSDSKDISNLFIKMGRIQNIIISLLLFGFILFGKQFIILWAGEEYMEAYYMTVAFFISLYIPLIQNLGITILQARNQMKFRSLLYIIIALCALIAEFVLAKLFGGLGCALAVSIALLLGQGLIMNIYYKRKQNIDIPCFWREILKMDVVPIILTSVAFIVLHNLGAIDNWIKLISSILVYCIIYIPLYIQFSMNEYERSILYKPIKKFIYG